MILDWTETQFWKGKAPGKSSWVKISAQELQMQEFAVGAINRDWETEGKSGNNINIIPDRAAQIWIFPFQT